jgi:glycine betaine/proline transport system substrate-binding protein
MSCFKTSRMCALVYGAVAIGGAVLMGGTSARAADKPGAGTVFQLTYDSTAETLFQTEIVSIGLERLGYEAKPILPLQIPAMYLAAATGDVQLTAAAWNPLQNAFFEKAGGAAQLERIGKLISNATQGYFVDIKTASAHNITSIEQLTDPKIAAVFAEGGSGKAQLIGCPPGWGCERAIEHQLDAYKLRPTVNHVQGDMAVLASEVIARYRAGKPVIYYTYNPMWLSQVLVLGKDVRQLTVPFTSLPEPTDPKLTTLSDGTNTGFTVNTIQVVANRKFIEANPAAKAWIEQVTIPVQDVVAENYQIYQGEKSEKQIRGHAEAWVAAHAKDVDGWLATAMNAGKAK